MWMIRYISVASQIPSPAIPLFLAENRILIVITDEILNVIITKTVVIEFVFIGIESFFDAFLILLPAPLLPCRLPSIRRCAAPTIVPEIDARTAFFRFGDAEINPDEIFEYRQIPVFGLLPHEEEWRPILFPFPEFPRQKLPVAYFLQEFRCCGRRLTWLADQGYFV